MRKSARETCSKEYGWHSSDATKPHNEERDAPLAPTSQIAATGRQFFVVGESVTCYKTNHKAEVCRIPFRFNL